MMEKQLADRESRAAATTKAKVSQMTTAQYAVAQKPMQKSTNIKKLKFMSTISASSSLKTRLLLIRLATIAWSNVF
jgi:hypothetical protein